LNEHHDHRLPRTDPKLLEKVRVKVLRPFYYQGKPLAADEIVTVEEWVAVDMVAIGKAEILIGR
jgi:hypothetical protein